MTAPRALREGQWERMLRADEENLAFFAERATLPGVSLFFAEHDNAPEFDVAVIYRVLLEDAEATLQKMLETYRTRGRVPHVRLSPLSVPQDWPLRLAHAGFVATGLELYFSVPHSLHLRENDAVQIGRVTTSADAKRFSEIQVAGFDISPAHRKWDGQLAQRHVAERRHAFYLAQLDGTAVGAARCIHLPGGTTAMAALATLPEARGNGVGTSLLARMVADARTVKSQVIFGAVIPGSDAAGIYERLGFSFHVATTTFSAHAVPFTS